MFDEDEVVEGQEPLDVYIFMNKFCTVKKKRWEKTITVSFFFFPAHFIYTNDTHAHKLTV